MLIRKPVEQVFEAFINPEITVNFWFSKSTGRLDENNEVIWTGFTLVLVGLKAYLKHNIKLNLIADRFPKELGDH
jgi:hypothetical protein